MKYTVPILTLMLACSSVVNQFTYYEPAGNESRLRILVERKGVWLGHTGFFCTINDSAVAEGTFSSGSDSFEVDGKYCGHAVKMSGYEKDISFRVGTTVSSTEKFYIIRVFIDEKEAARFDF
ncbi:MAG: hypothetical protein QUS35_07945 [bacterium]|nr:hypothetical protein [bacterium]